MPIKKIESLSDMLKHLKDDLDPKVSPVWYRGHSIGTWQLLSSYDRLKRPPKETSLVNEFRQNANYLLDKHSPDSSFDWLFLMQHYGVPTRLLDWTESPLIALYFAIESDTRGSKNQDGALWVLYPGKLNSKTNAERNEYIPAFEEKEYMESYSTEKYDKGRELGLNPIAAIATRNNPRIQAQLGVFTISHRDKVPIEDIVDRSHVIKYEITSNAKPDIAKELKLLAISKFQIFPELASIGQKIKERLS